MLAYLAVVCISFLISGLWAKYIAAIADQRAEAATAYDLLLMLASSSTYQIWALNQNSFSLLVVGDLAAAAGTYCFLRWTKTHRSTKRTSKKNISWGAKIMKQLF